MGNSMSMGPIPAATTAFLHLSASLFNSSADPDYSGDARCPGAIRLQSFNYSIQQHGSEYAGRPRSVESVEHGDFNVSRFADTRSPHLFRLVARAEFVSEVNVLVFSESPRQTAPYLIFNMTCVHVASYAIEYGSGPYPTELIGFKYGNLKIIGRGQYLPVAMFKYAPGGYCEESFSQVMNIPKALPGLTTAGGAKGDSDP
jgi:type VI protein secretion system component Hcp